MNRKKAVKNEENSNEWRADGIQGFKENIERNMQEVVSRAHFISGPQVRELEETLAAYVGSRHCISCANGTDAITIALLAHGVGAGDAVFVPDFTFFSSGECPALIGATPIFVDVETDTFNLSPSALEKAVKSELGKGKLKPKAVVAVDLFGLPADYDRIRAICSKYGLLLLEDGAQGFGGKYHGQRACSFGDISTTSFFPAKPLGCYGDGGAIFTDDDHIAALCRSLAVHGKNQDDKYDNVRLGMNSRLDTLQAGILLVKFAAFEEYELADVNKMALHYTEQLKDVNGLTVPVVPEGYDSSWAQYTLCLSEGTDRAAVQAYMKERGIPTMVYYAKPMHRQGAFAGTRSAIADCPNTELLCERVLCLPIHPYLTTEETKLVADTLKEALKQCRI